MHVLVNPAANAGSADVGTVADATARVGPRQPCREPAGRLARVHLVHGGACRTVLESISWPWTLDFGVGADHYLSKSNVPPRGGSRGTIAGLARGLSASLGPGGGLIVGSGGANTFGAAGGGKETLDGSASSGPVVYLATAGSDVVRTGSGVGPVVLGPALNTAALGTEATLLVAGAGSATGWDASRAWVQVAGGGGGLAVVGVTQLGASSFVRRRPGDDAWVTTPG